MKIFEASGFHAVMVKYKFSDFYYSIISVGSREISNGQLPLDTCIKFKTHWCLYLPIYFKYKIGTNCRYREDMLILFKKTLLAPLGI